LRQGDYEIQVLVHGRRVREYQHDGENFVEGRMSQQYKLRLVNHSPRRALFVVSIDGLSIMDGQSANRQQSGGYVVNANETADIPGWRLNDDKVAQFIFSEIDQSYAHLMGKPENVGVIGCAVFAEKIPFVLPSFKPWPREVYGPLPHFPGERRFGPDTRIKSRAFGATLGGEAESVTVGACADAVSQDVGTGFGEMADHRVTSVHFNREDQPTCVMVVRYMGPENLTKLGIDLRAAAKPQVAVVQPFPGNITITGCQPPVGYRGT